MKASTEHQRIEPGPSRAWKPSGTRGVNANVQTSKEAVTNLAAHRLLVLPAALLSALVRLDAEAGAASAAGGLAAGAAGFLLVPEQLHQQLKLQTAGRLAPPPRPRPHLPSLSKTTGKL